MGGKLGRKELGVRQHAMLLLFFTNFRFFIKINYSPFKAFSIALATYPLPGLVQGLVGPFKRVLAGLGRAVALQTCVCPSPMAQELW